ncbi:MAG: hypothetical protein AAFZ18_13025 [Myxococcota bacterium]
MMFLLLLIANLSATVIAIRAPHFESRPRWLLVSLIWLLPGMSLLLVAMTRDGEKRGSDSELAEKLGYGTALSMLRSSAGEKGSLQTYEGSGLSLAVHEDEGTLGLAPEATEREHESESADQELA